MKYVLIVIGVLIIGFISINKIRNIKSNESLSNDLSSNENTEINEVDIKKLLHIIFPQTCDLVFTELEALNLNPKDFFLKNSDIFEDYYFNIDSLPSKKDLSLIVIGHYLSKDSNFAMIDWNQSNEDTLYFINSILSRHSLEEIKTSTPEHTSLLKADYLDYDSQEYMEPYDFLKLCGDIVIESGYSLIELGRGNDAYELFLVESKLQEPLLKLSKDNGFSMRLISSSEYK